MFSGGLERKQWHELVKHISIVFLFLILNNCLFAKSLDTKTFALRCSSKKAVLKNFVIFTRKDLC